MSFQLNGNRQHTGRGKGAVGKPRAALPEAYKRPRWEEGGGGFSEQTPIGAGVSSPRREDLSRRQLADSCFESFVQ